MDLFDRQHRVVSSARQWLKMMSAYGGKEKLDMFILPWQSSLCLDTEGFHRGPAGADSISAPIHLIDNVDGWAYRVMQTCEELDGALQDSVSAVHGFNRTREHSPIEGLMILLVGSPECNCQTAVTMIDPSHQDSRIEIRVVDISSPQR